ncbi:glycosyltransferase [Sutcliffiella horikoshii]|uniref:Glycosyltransferase n=1 Tax=Sutcliffiella horikoshii TaxID=79883 RepID=A0AA94WTV2_9BACI|nr:glycosyltransferase [Sutcliffiella horikoshii]TYS59865.1 glycosyltransferase [Sutcliffiella horikoshii]
MNILYISCLSGNKSAGLYYSVPLQIKAQSKIDNVFWYNLNNNYIQNEDSIVKCYSTKDFPNEKIEYLPQPFNNPDIVIFEGFYFYSYYKIAKQLKKKGTPYIIVPRSALTLDAQKSKKLKKKLANSCFFKQFAQNASAIQYLTRNEHEASGDIWNNNPIIIPNGIIKKSNIKVFRKKNSLKGVFIGRLDIYQKGIDLLLEACSLVKDKLEENNCTIDIYGPDQNGTKKTLKDLTLKYELTNIVKIHDAIFDSEKEDIILKSDFFVLTSRFEGHPMAVIEALSYGIPCLVTSGTNMADEIESFKAGWASDVSVTGIVNSFNDLLEEKDKISNKSSSAVKLSERYDWSRIAEVSKKNFKKIIN